MVDAINKVTENIVEWSKAYRFNPALGDYEHCKHDVEFPSLANFNALGASRLKDKTNSFEAPSMLRKFFG